MRVKREATPAEDDVFEDIIPMDGSGMEGHSASTDRLAVRIIQECKNLTGDNGKPSVSCCMISHEIFSIVLSAYIMIITYFLTEMDEKEFQFQTQSNLLLQQKRRKYQKKREMRVFISSTFKDFAAEREQLIKKTLNEVI